MLSVQPLEAEVIVGLQGQSVWGHAGARVCCASPVGLVGPGACIQRQDAVTDAG